MGAGAARRACSVSGRCSTARLSRNAAGERPRAPPRRTRPQAWHPSRGIAAFGEIRVGRGWGARKNRSTVSKKQSRRKQSGSCNYRDDDELPLVAVGIPCSGFELPLLGGVFSSLSDRVVDPGNLFADVEFGFVGWHRD